MRRRLLSCESSEVGLAGRSVALGAYVATSNASRGGEDRPTVKVSVRVRPRLTSIRPLIRTAIACYSENSGRFDGPPQFTWKA